MLAPSTYTELLLRSMPQKKMSCVSSWVGDMTGAAAGATLRQAVVVGVGVRSGVFVGVAQYGQLHPSGKYRTAPGAQVAGTQDGGVQVAGGVGVDSGAVGVDSEVVGTGVGVCSGVGGGAGHPCRALRTQVTSDSIPGVQMSPSGQTETFGQELLGHKDVATTKIYTHVLNRGGRGVVSPADRL